MFPVAALGWMWWDRTMLLVLDFNENLSLLLKMLCGGCVHFNFIPISIWEWLDLNKRENSQNWLCGEWCILFCGKIKICTKLKIWLKAHLDRGMWEGKHVISCKNNHKTVLWVELIVTSYWKRPFRLEDNFLFSFLDHEFRCFCDLGEARLTLKNRTRHMVFKL